MSKKMFFMFALLIGLTLSCAGELFRPPQTSELEEEYEISYGETIQLGETGVAFLFEGDIHDSRCPANAYCLWPGVVIVPLTIISDGDSIKIRIARIVDGQSSPPGLVDTLGFRFELLRVSPYPDGSQIDSSEYVATISVSVSPGEKIVPEVIITRASQSYIEVYPYELVSARVEGDSLILQVNYSGGCQQHYFQLFMSPGSFAESHPVQATLYLRHYGEWPFCESYMSTPLTFDLGPIARLYHESYGGAGGTIKLNIVNCTADLNPPVTCVASWSGLYLVPDLLD